MYTLRFDNNGGVGIIADTIGRYGEDIDLIQDDVYMNEESEISIVENAHEITLASSICYIRKDTINSLRSTSSWLQADKNALLRDVLNKDLTKLKSYKIIKAKL